METREKLGENDGQNGKNVVPEAETAKHRKMEETNYSRRIRWKHVKNWAKTMVGMAKTWYRRPKQLNVGKRKKRTIHVEYGGSA